MKKAIILLIAVLTAMLCLGAAAEEENPVIMRVGSHEYRLSDAQTYLNQNALALLGLSEAAELTNEDREMLMDATSQHFIILAIVEDLIDEHGLRETTEADEEMISRKVRETYNEVWQEAKAALAEEYPDMEIAESDITQALAAIGYDFNSLHEQLTLLSYEEKLIDLLCTKKEPSEEEILAFYDDNFVKPGREKYEGNIKRYEEEVFLNGESTAYVPEGYFYVKHIQLDIPQMREEAVLAAKAVLEEKEALCQLAYDALANAAILGTDDQPEKRAAYLAALDEQDAAQAEVDAKVAELVQGAEESIEEIRERYAAGESFEDLMRLYSSGEIQAENDPGFPYHPDSAMWLDEAKAALNQLTEAGELSEAVYFPESGIYLYQRGADIGENGRLPLSESNRQQIRDYLIYMDQMDQLQQIISEKAEQTPIWSDDSQIIFIY